MGSKEKKQSNHETAPGTGHHSKRNPFILVGTIIILVIVVVAFVFVPAIEVAFDSQKAKLTFGSYDGTPIKLAQGNYFSNQISSLQSNVQQDQYNMFVGFQIYQQAFNNTVVHIAKMKEMEKAGFSVPDKIVDEQVIEMPMFQENGKFSATAYRAYPNDRKLLIWNSLREQIISGTYDQAVAGMRIPSKEIEFVNMMNNKTRSFEMAVLPLDSYPESEVRSFAEKNPDLFKQIHASKITITTSEKEAKKLLDSIKSGTSTFEEAAKNNSKDNYAEKGGDMGIKLAYEFTTEIPAEGDRVKVLSLAAGEYSPVVKVADGWAFFRIEEAAHNIDLSNANNMTRVRTYIKDFERGHMEDWIIERANQFISLTKTQGFRSAAVTEGIKVSTFGPLPINYGDVNFFPSLSEFNIQELASASADANFWKHAFKTPVETASEPIVLGNNIVVLYPAEEHLADGSNGFIDAYYPYMTQSFSRQSLSTQILASSKLKNHFMDTYLGLISPQN